MIDDKQRKDNQIRLFLYNLGLVILALTIGVLIADWNIIIADAFLGIVAIPVLMLSLFYIMLILRFDYNVFAKKEI